VGICSSAAATDPLSVSREGLRLVSNPRNLWDGVGWWFVVISVVLVVVVVVVVVAVGCLGGCWGVCSGRVSHSFWMGNNACAMPSEKTVAICSMQALLERSCCASLPFSSPMAKDTTE